MGFSDYDRWSLIKNSSGSGDKFLDMLHSQINPFTGVEENQARVAFKRKVLIDRVIDNNSRGDDLIRQRKLKAFYYEPVELDIEGKPLRTTRVAHIAETVKKGRYYSYSGKNPEFENRVFRLLYRMPFGRLQNYFRVIDVNTNEEFVIPQVELDWLQDTRIYY
jgi:hypothetical protein